MWRWGTKPLLKKASRPLIFVAFGSSAAHAKRPIKQHKRTSVRLYGLEFTVWASLIRNRCRAKAFSQKAMTVSRPQMERPEALLAFDPFGVASSVAALHPLPGNTSCDS